MTAVREAQESSIGGPASEQKGTATWRSERLIGDGDRWFDGLLKDIAEAKVLVLVDMYIFQDDETGRRVLEALVQAGRRGVTVRILVDGFGSSGFVWNLAPKVIREPVDIRVYHPLPDQVLSSAFRNGSRLLNLVRLIPRINQRDHRKIWIIDGGIAWVGSFNVGDFALRSRVGDKAWNEVGARVEGEAVCELAFAFEHAWHRSWRFHGSRLQVRRLLSVRKVPPQRSGLVRLNDRLRLRWREYLRLLHGIDEAKVRVWVCAAYFVPGRRLLRALEGAAKRGVDVRLLMSTRSDVPFMAWVATAFWAALLARGIRVLSFGPGFVHAKALLIDDWLSVGSTNLNMRSLLHDLEADVVLNRRESLANFVERWHGAEMTCRQVTLADFQATPWYCRLVARLLLHLRYWL